MDKLYALNHSPIDFHFSQNPRDFMVREIPLYPFSENGEHLILNIRKKGLNTLEMIKILSGIIGCKTGDIGYAGLKDKSATTSQYISIHKNFAQSLENKLSLLEEKNIKILSSCLHSNKLKIGHLKGNNFFIRLKKITPSVFVKIESVLQTILKNGLPNYFGYQRFGKDGNNHIEGKKIAHQEFKLRNKKINNFLISSYQSYLFNQWLESRIKISKIFESFEPSEIKHALSEQQISLSLETIKAIRSQPHFFKLFEGDLMHHYPYGKLFTSDIQNDSERFFSKDIVPTGLLAGVKTPRSTSFSRKFEETFDDQKLKADGSRRFAWVWIEDLKYRYIQEQAWVELEFSLPKGSYATTLIEELAHKNIRID
ncbi:tRNA pseudouridine(13) synthase TruD [Helicobacter sp. 12S02232-10]|uniref:tRNA pseudouridine(13) synthase TruD n=1 Tax=Helicobacter sp. 12S02232-10 TaxID=1476197 RepID=UPI000BA5FF71|nr:tRNA pseudouridine(13) synthase TruD [Helicobacter sp. 12S02232-10]PAF49882.1 tRNA pseudouridine(13) synthase TruD [Helicobacter sp. 12S02232-10]